MGFSSLTRYDLFLESGNIIESGDEVIRFIDYSSVKKYVLWFGKFNKRIWRYYK